RRRLPTRRNLDELRAEAMVHVVVEPLHEAARHFDIVFPIKITHRVHQPGACKALDLAPIANGARRRSLAITTSILTRLAFLRADVDHMTVAFLEDDEVIGQLIAHRARHPRAAVQRVRWTREPAAFLLAVVHAVLLQRMYRLRHDGVTLQRVAPLPEFMIVRHTTELRQLRVEGRTVLQMDQLTNRQLRRALRALKDRLRRRPERRFLDRRLRRAVEWILTHIHELDLSPFVRVRRDRSDDRRLSRRRLRRVQRHSHARGAERDGGRQARHGRFPTRFPRHRCLQSDEALRTAWESRARLYFTTLPMSFWRHGDVPRAMSQRCTGLD